MTNSTFHEKRVVQKYISLGLVLVLLGIATPAFAGDYVNARLLPQKMPLPALASPVLSNAQAGFGLKSSLAFALAQPEQNQTPARPAEHGLSGKGKAFKWVGVGLMGAGGLTMVGAAAVSNPCNGYAAGTCVSNYTSARAALLAIGGVTAGIGAVLFLLHNRYRD